MKVYIVVRNTSDVEYNTVDVFQSVHATPEEADKMVEILKKDFGFTEKDSEYGTDDSLEILERDI